MATIQVSLYEAFGAYALFGLCLMGWLALKRQPPLTILGYLALFTWFCVAQAMLVWWTPAINVPFDGLFYFEHARAIAESGFAADTLASNLRGTTALLSGDSLTNLGVNTFILLEAVVIYLLFPSYALVHIGSIFVATMAVFYAAQVARVALGRYTEKWVIAGFLVYGAFYWTVLQNLREAPLLLFTGIALVHYLLWWQRGTRPHVILALVSAVIATMFRAEYGVLFIGVIGLTALFRYGHLSRRMAQSLVFLPIVAVLAFSLAMRVTHDNPLRMINSAREVRLDTGQGYQATQATIDSYGELIAGIPNTFRFFLVPILPWQTDAGGTYFRAYVHSLTGLALVLIALVGIRRVWTLSAAKYPLRRPMFILLVAFTGTAVLYSFADIGASAAARHSSFYYYFLFAAWVPIGGHSLVYRYGARLVASAPSPTRVASAAD